MLLRLGGTCGCFSLCVGTTRFVEALLMRSSPSTTEYPRGVWMSVTTIWFLRFSRDRWLNMGRFSNNILYSHSPPPRALKAPRPRQAPSRTPCRPGDYPCPDKIIIYLASHDCQYHYEGLLHGESPLVQRRQESQNVGDPAHSLP